MSGRAFLLGPVVRLAGTAPADLRATACGLGRVGRTPSLRCTRAWLAATTWTPSHSRSSTGAVNSLADDAWTGSHGPAHRYRLDGSSTASRRMLTTSAATDARLEFPTTVLHDLARLSAGWRVHQKIVELAATQAKLHRDDYDSICADHGLDAEKAAILLKSLEGAGVVVRIAGADLDSTLFLRPDEGILRAVSSNLGLPYATVDQDRVQRLQRILDEKLASLNSAQKQKEELDYSARRATHRTIALMLGYLALQNGAFFYGTFFVWSWDIMEPITYFWGQSFMLLCFAYFIRSEREWGFDGVQERMVKAKRRRRYQREGFDIDKYDRDYATVTLYRQRIRALEKERI